MTAMAKSQFPPFSSHDEISLFDLLDALWKQKIVLVVTALLVMLAATAYAFLATPVYQVQSVLRPANLKDLDAANISGLYTLTPDDALRQLGVTLSSYETRRSFFRNNPHLFEAIREPHLSLEQAFERFNADGFRMLYPDARQGEGLSGYVGIQLAYPEGVDGVGVVNGLVRHAAGLQKQAIAEDIATLIENRLNQLERRIATARAAYEAQKNAEIARLKEEDTLKRAQLEDELAALRKQLGTRRQHLIAELDEAIKIAKALRITKPTTPSAIGGAARAEQGNIILTEINSNQVPLYFMGTEALEAERETLLERTSDDFIEPRIAEINKELQLLEHNRQIEVLLQRENEDLFLSEIAAFREEEARLKTLALDLSSANLVEIDQPAVTPLRPIKPRKALILALGLVLGGMLGVFAALIRAMFQRQSTGRNQKGYVTVQTEA